MKKLLYAIFKPWVTSYQYLTGTYERSPGAKVGEDIEIAINFMLVLVQVLMMVIIVTNIKN